MTNTPAKPQTDVLVEARKHANDGWCPPRASELISRLCNELDAHRSGNGGVYDTAGNYTLLAQNAIVSYAI